MNELIRQTKYPPICFPSQITKLNVRQLYHSYGMELLRDHPLFSGTLGEEVNPVVRLKNATVPVRETSLANQHFYSLV